MKISKVVVSRRLYLPVLVVLIIVLTVFTFQMGARYGSDGDSGIRISGNKEREFKSELDESVDFDLFWEVWDVLSSNYVDNEELTDKEMFYGALKGMVKSSGDPYTIFLDPTDYIELREDLNGSFEGIGAEIGLKNEIITVIAPLSGMPAEKAGLRAGDLIMFVNEETTMGMSVMDAVKKIRGEKGTDVMLTVAREGADKLIDVTITRGVIVVKSVNYEFDDNGILTIEVSNFNNDTDSLFNEAVNEALIQNPKGIIIDLRNNPGGYLDTAVLMASKWIKEDVIVVEDYGDGRKVKHNSLGAPSLQDFKTVVLVNQGSASASEIVAGALQDYKKATIVGKTTFGKGSVQALKSLSNNSAVKVTIAKWLTPTERSISEHGVTPDIEVEYTIEDYEKKADPQMDKAIEIILK